MPQCRSNGHRGDRYRKHHRGPRSLVASGFSTLICGIILLLVGFCIWYFSTPTGSHLSFREDYGSFKFGDSPDNHRRIMQSIAMIMMAFGGCLVSAGIIVALCGAVKSKSAVPEEPQQQQQQQQAFPYTIDMSEQRQTSARPQPPQESQLPPTYNNVQAERDETDPTTAGPGQPVLSGYPASRATFAQVPPSAPSDAQQWNVKPGEHQFAYNNAYDAFPGRRLYPQLEPLAMNQTNPSGNTIYTVTGQPQLGLAPSNTILPGQFQPFLGVGGNYSDMTENGHHLQNGTPGNQRF